MRNTTKHLQNENHTHQKPFTKTTHIIMDEKEKPTNAEQGPAPAETAENSEIMQQDIPDEITETPTFLAYIREGFWN